MRFNEEAVARCYSTWGTSYYEDYYGKNAPYPPVHTQLLRRFLIETEARTLLDAGCGPASFLRDVMDLDMDLYGFDLTAEMVAEGRRVFTDAGRPADHLWQGSVLDRTSFCPPSNPEMR